MGIGDDGAEVADGFRADEGGEFAGGLETPAAEVAKEEAGGPRVARAVGVDDLADAHGLDAVKVAVAGDPRAVLADLDGGEDAVVAEAAGEVGVAGALVVEEGADLVLVGEDDVDAPAELREEPVAGGVDDLEGREVEAGGAAGGAGGGEDGVGEGLVEDEVALDVRVAAAGEVGGGDLLGASVMAAPRWVRMVRWASGVTRARQRALAWGPRLNRLPSTPARAKACW